MGERGVNEGLVVDVFVRLGALHEPVGDEQTAEGLGLDHLHGLELGLALVEHLVNLRRRGDGERVRKKRWSSAGDGKAADGTHPVGDGEAILEDLVVPVALVEDVAADAARVSHGTCKYVCARLQMCQDGQTVNSPPPPIAGTIYTRFYTRSSRCRLHPVLVILWAIIIRVYLPQMHTQANMQDEHNCNGECASPRKCASFIWQPKTKLS